jgi:hypothetical protein
VTPQPEAAAMPAATGSSPNGLIEPLLASLEALAAAGQVETACRLAGQACAALRRSDPRGAHRFNALLHRLTRHLDW